MSDEHKVKIRINRRTLEFNLRPEHEEYIRYAAKLLNEGIETFKKQYIAEGYMEAAALKCTAELLQSKKKTEKEKADLEKKLEALNAKLEKYIDNIKNT